MKHLTLLIACIIIIGSQVSAFDTAHLQKLKDTNECIACDLSGANLAYASLRGANLKGAELMGAILCNTTMRDDSVIYSGC